MRGPGLQLAGAVFLVVLVALALLDCHLLVSHKLAYRPAFLHLSASPFRLFVSASSFLPLVYPASLLSPNHRVEDNLKLFVDSLCTWNHQAPQTLLEYPESPRHPFSQALKILNRPDLKVYLGSCKLLQLFLFFSLPPQQTAISS